MDLGFQGGSWGLRAGSTARIASGTARGRACTTPHGPAFRQQPSVRDSDSPTNDSGKADGCARSVEAAGDEEGRVHGGVGEQPQRGDRGLRVVVVVEVRQRALDPLVRVACAAAFVRQEEAGAKGAAACTYSSRRSRRPCRRPAGRAGSRRSGSRRRCGRPCRSPRRTRSAAAGGRSLRRQNRHASSAGKVSAGGSGRTHCRRRPRRSPSP